MALTQRLYTDQTVQQLHTAEPIDYWMKNGEEERRGKKEKMKGQTCSI